MLERRSVISGYEGSKPRQVLVGAGDVDRFIANLRERDGTAPKPPPAEPRPATAEAEPVHE
jgi:S-DNA-T family DNA segregation ATPase FtsK/SpoIIIE